MCGVWVCFSLDSSSVFSPVLSCVGVNRGVCEI